MKYSIAIPHECGRQLTKHLLRSDGQEDLCFALYYASKGHKRTTALIHTFIPPLHDDRCVHGNVSFSSQYFERAIGEAIKNQAGLAFLHSHVGPGWQGMSSDDIAAELGHAAAPLGATGLPLVGLTLGTDGAWSGRFWIKTGSRKYEYKWCETVRVVGEHFKITYNNNLLPVPKFKPELERTISAWGEDAQAKLARLCFGIVGAGSVGSIVAESLARTGIQHVKLIDFDDVETVNLDRLLNVTRRDVGLSKAVAIAKVIKKSATASGFVVEPLECSIVEEEGFRHALDCDILFSCVDRPWPRSVLNFIAYAHLIPVVDGGIKVRQTSRGGLKKADWRAHIASPGRKCLECLGQYDPGLVSVERDGYLDDPRYIETLPEDHPIRRNENVFAFSLSLASMEMLEMLAMVINPLGICNLGAQSYHLIPGRTDVDFSGCEDTCYYQTLIARGERCGISVTGRHARAEDARSKREKSNRPTTLFIGNIKNWILGKGR